MNLEDCDNIRWEHPPAGHPCLDEDEDAVEQFVCPSCKTFMVKSPNRFCIACSIE